MVLDEFFHKLIVPESGYQQEPTVFLVTKYEMKNCKVPKLHICTSVLKEKKEYFDKTL